MHYLIAVAIIVPVLFAVLVPIVLWQGYVLWVMWGWFIVPLGAPEISVPWAIGFASVAHLLHPTVHNPEAKDNATRWGRIAEPFLQPALILLIGYVAKSFM